MEVEREREGATQVALNCKNSTRYHWPEWRGSLNRILPHAKMYSRGLTFESQPTRSSRKWLNGNRKWFQLNFDSIQYYSIKANVTGKIWPLFTRVMFNQGKVFLLSFFYKKNFKVEINNSNYFLPILLTCSKKWESKKLIIQNLKNSQNVSNDFTSTTIWTIWTKRTNTCARNFFLFHQNNKVITKVCFVAVLNFQALLEQVLHLFSSIFYYENEKNGLHFIVIIIVWIWTVCIPFYRIYLDRHRLVAPHRD